MNNIASANITDNRFNRFDDELIDKYFNEKGKQAIEAYVAQRVIEGRIDELKHLDSLTYSFMSLGNDFDYSYRQSAIDARIKELTNNVGGEDE